MSRPILQVIIGSTRPGRVGPAIARWFYDLAAERDAIDVELVDVASFNLPVFDEPQHPITREYAHEHTRYWSETISRADGFVFVIPEYNHSLNAATKNALDYLYHEWRHKSAGILSYGGAAMGTRAAQALKPVLTALKLVHAGDVTVPLVTAPVHDGVFAGNEQLARSAAALLDELTVITPVLMERRHRSTASS